MITRLVAAGFVTPARGPRREYRFSFQDMVLLRTAQGLQAAQIPPRRIVRSLRRLRESLPEQMPLSGLRIAAIGNEVVVRDGSAPWQAESGQLLFDFEVDAAAPGSGPSSGPRSGPGSGPGSTPGGTVHALRGPGAAATDWFQRAVELETRDPAGAQAAYRRAIEQAPTNADTYLNLGVLLGEAGRHDEAAALYRQGIARCPPEALLHFNLGVALEEQQRFGAAIAAYDRALAIDPALADAHFNVAQLHDQLGQARRAIRHYSAYRQLRRDGP